MERLVICDSIGSADGGTGGGTDGVRATARFPPGGGSDGGRDGVGGSGCVVVWFSNASRLVGVGGNGGGAERIPVDDGGADGRVDGIADGGGGGGADTEPDVRID